ncbi:MAG: DUF2680 domain-containing protein [Thermincolia bacterium]
MKKKFIMGLVAVLVLAVAVPAAYAAISDKQKQEIEGIYKQMFDLRKQVIDKYVEAGELTKEQGDAMKKNMDEAAKYRQEKGTGIGSGGCGGPGMMGPGGMMGGFGGGMTGYSL